MVRTPDSAFFSIAQACSHYAVAGPRIVAATAQLAGLPPDMRRDETMDALRRGLLKVAAAHDGPHGGCRTCDAIREGLAALLAALDVDVRYAVRSPKETVF